MPRSFTAVPGCRRGGPVFARSGIPATWLLLSVIAWAAVIWCFSTDAFSHHRTAGVVEAVVRAVAPAVSAAELTLIHEALRKIAHLTVYAVLGGLAFATITRGRTVGRRTAAVVALSIGLAWAVVDEVHQSTVPSRTASVADVALDITGVLSALAIALPRYRTGSTA